MYVYVYVCVCICICICICICTYIYIYIYTYRLHPPARRHHASGRDWGERQTTLCLLLFSFSYLVNHMVPVSVTKMYIYESLCLATQRQKLLSSP